MTSVMEDISELHAELQRDAAKVSKFKDLIAQATRLQSEVTNQSRARRKRLERLVKASAAQRALQEGPEAEAVERQLRDMRAVCAASTAISPSTGSLFVRLFLGRVNVRVLQEADRTRLRDEYNKFKSRTNIMFCVLPIFNMFVFYRLSSFWGYTNWCHVLTHVWLLYYYVSLALRENILRVNGSNIRPWWITHHYLSSFMSIVLLTWPEGENYNKFLPQFNLYCLCQGVVQMMQAAYQKKRLYIRKAIGKAGHMDVSQTETITETPKELYLLLIFIFAVHLFQVYNGLSLGHAVWAEFNLTQPWYNFREEVQAIIVSVLFVVLGSVNFQQTVMVVVDKQRKKTRRRKLARSHSGRSNSGGTSNNASTSASTGKPKSS